jgi:hypothetical protein
LKSQDALKAFISSLPASYTVNGRAWMTKEIFCNWLIETHKTMAKEKIIILLDNCSAHRVDGRQEYVKLDFLPVSCTSLFQPLEQGIIQNTMNAK